MWNDSEEADSQRSPLSGPEPMARSDSDLARELQAEEDSRGYGYGRGIHLPWERSNSPPLPSPAGRQGSAPSIDRLDFRSFLRDHLASLSNVPRPDRPRPGLSLPPPSMVPPDTPVADSSMSRRERMERGFPPETRPDYTPEQLAITHPAALAAPLDSAYQSHRTHPGAIASGLEGEWEQKGDRLLLTVSGFDGRTIVNARQLGTQTWSQGANGVAGYVMGNQIIGMWSDNTEGVLEDPNRIRWTDGDVWTRGEAAAQDEAKRASSRIIPNGTRVVARFGMYAFAPATVLAPGNMSAYLEHAPVRNSPPVSPRASHLRMLLDALPFRSRTNSITSPTTITTAADAGTSSTAITSSSSAAPATPVTTTAATTTSTAIAAMAAAAMAAAAISPAMTAAPSSSSSSSSAAAAAAVPATAAAARPTQQRRRRRKPNNNNNNGNNNSNNNNRTTTTESKAERDSKSDPPATTTTTTTTAVATAAATVTTSTPTSTTTIASTTPAAITIATSSTTIASTTSTATTPGGSARINNSLATASSAIREMTRSFREELRRLPRRPTRPQSPTSPNMLPASPVSLSSLLAPPSPPSSPSPASSLASPLLLSEHEAKAAFDGEYVVEFDREWAGEGNGPHRGVLQCVGETHLFEPAQWTAGSPEELAPGSRVLVLRNCDHGQGYLPGTVIARDEDNGSYSVRSFDEELSGVPPQNLVPFAQWRAPRGDPPERRAPPERLLGGYFSRYRQPAVDLDNMSYEEILELESRMGVVKGREAKIESVSLLPVRKYEKKVGREEDCPICTEEFTDGERVKTLPCFHTFHEDEIDHWLLTEKNACPVCKMPIDGDDFDVNFKLN